jgi:hypothetical protein
MGTQLFLHSEELTQKGRNTNTLMLSKHALEEYKEIHRQETGKVLPDEVLVDEAINLLTLFNFVYRPIKKAWLQEYGQQTRDNTGLAERKTKVASQDGSQSKPEKRKPTKAD